MKRTYLRRFWLTMAVAVFLAFYPAQEAIVRLLCLLLFGMLAAWTDRAQVLLSGNGKGESKQ